MTKFLLILTITDYISDDNYYRYGPKSDDQDFVSTLIKNFKISSGNSSQVVLNYDLTEQSLINFSNDSDHVWHGKGGYGELLFWTKSGFGWVGQSAVPTGWLLVLVLTTMVIFALPIVRRKGLFQVFVLLLR